MFGTEDRERARDRVLALAETDPRAVADELDGVHLFDLDAGAAVYRVFSPARLPFGVIEPLSDTLVRSLEPDELRRALRSAIEGLLRESADAAGLAARVKAQLLELAEARGSQSSR